MSNYDDYEAHNRHSSKVVGDCLAGATRFSGKTDKIGSSATKKTFVLGGRISSKPSIRDQKGRTHGAARAGFPAAAGALPQRVPGEPRRGLVRLGVGTSSLSPPSPCSRPSAARQEIVLSEFGYRSGTSTDDLSSVSCQLRFAALNRLSDPTRSGQIPNLPAEVCERLTHLSGLLKPKHPRSGLVSPIRITGLDAGGTEPTPDEFERRGQDSNLRRGVNPSPI